MSSSSIHREKLAKSVLGARFKIANARAKKKTVLFSQALYRNEDTILGQNSAKGESIANWRTFFFNFRNFFLLPEATVNIFIQHQSVNPMNKK